MVKSIAAIYEVPKLAAWGLFRPGVRIVIFADEQAGILNAIGRVQPAADTNLGKLEMNLGIWAVEDWKIHSPEANASLFRRRHQITVWLLGLTLSLNVLLPVVCIKLLGVSKNTYEDLGVHYTGVLVFVAAPYMIFRFRCPRCNATPASSKVGTSAVLLFPKSCANCNSPLLPKHRWAVD